MPCLRSPFLVDVICLQEVTRDYLHAILAAAYFRDGRWLISDITGSSCEPHGTIVLSRFPLKSLFQWSFPTSMFRVGYIAKISLDGTELAIATAHLESLNNASVRIEQLNILATKLSVSKNALIMGDFNMDARSNYSDVEKVRERRNTESTFTIRDLAVDQSALEDNLVKEVLSEYTDVWPQLHGEEPGYTRDSETNAIITDGYEQVRIDRVFAKLDQAAYEVVAMERVGLEPFEVLAEDGNKIHMNCSDHYGLVVTLKATQ